ncbi:glycosyltransferase [Acetobacteraceae bacterium KSS8]|uniref:Glycosyltransferase n=1 Tax=Endosaccharibacter trunci TaxID=2812733 RepID=A0ABT1W440_9PROT|nr:glycosyltransferase [Acetobacteraceae bacterium KSS8]
MTVPGRIDPAPGGSLEISVVIPCFRERPNIRPMVAALDAALAELRWEAIFVDDNSPDGTAEEIRAVARTDQRVRGLRRIGRRGLASAVIEGILSSSAEMVAVIDGDLQHDETQIPVLLEAVRSGRCDIAVASRHAEGGDAAGLSSAWRHRLSEGGIRMAQAVLPKRSGFPPLRDPMSGFFLCERRFFDQVAPYLSGHGFKILLDLILSAPRGTGEVPRVLELPARFRPRLQGESKLDALVLVQFAAMLLDKFCRGLLPLRFLSFALVGLAGVAVNLLVLDAGLWFGFDFNKSQVIATIAATLADFWLNNTLTYRDRRLRGGGLLIGLPLFLLVCAIGNVAGIGIARALYDSHHGWQPAGAAGAAIAVVWNYAMSSTLIWRAR